MVRAHYAFQITLVQNNNVNSSGIRKEVFESINEITAAYYLGWQPVMPFPGYRPEGRRQ
jgi:hypothetical protein